VPDLEFTSLYKRRRKNKSKQMRDAIDECVRKLHQNPRHPGLHSHRVNGAKGVWESYVDEANRVTWQYGEGSIILRNNCNHDILKRRP
jgi:hypothetical protein